MKLKKNVQKLKSVFVSSFLLTLVSCGTVKVNNQEWCGDFGELGAECFHTQSAGKRTIEKPEWDEYRFGMLCAKPDVFADMKRTILQLCQLNKNKCIYDRTENTITFYNGKEQKLTVVTFFGDLEKFKTEVKNLKR